MPESSVVAFVCKNVKRDASSSHIRYALPPDHHKMME